MRVKEESENAGLKFTIHKTKILASSPITSWQIEREKVEIMTNFIFLGSNITGDDDCSHEIKRHLLLGKKAMTNLDSILRNRDIIFRTKFGTIRAMVFVFVFFPSSHVQIWELDLKEGWTPNNWWLWTVVTEKTREHPLDNKEIKPVNPKGNEP